MKNLPETPLSAAQVEALQARFAKRVSARLDDAAQSLPHDISERLRVAREQAIRAALSRQAQAQVVIAPVSDLVVAPALVPAGAPGMTTVESQGDAAPSLVDELAEWSIQLVQGRKHPTKRTGLGEDKTPWGWRLASLVPAVLLVAGLWGIHVWSRHERVQAAAEVDMALLTDDLPPAAYTDPGFEEYLKADNAPAQAQSLPGQEKDLDTPTLTDDEEIDPKGATQP